EDPARALDERRGDAVLVLDGGLQTGGLGEVVSLSAVQDPKVHPAPPWFPRDVSRVDSIIVSCDASTAGSDSLTLLVIDTDPGVDDALALLLAWGSPGVRVEAITTVAGNVPLGQCTVNLFRLLALRRPEPWPLVAAGAEAPLARPLKTAEGYHGADGLGALGDWPEVEARPGPSGAVELLVEKARHHGARLTLVALGPLTNIALA